MLHFGHVTLHRSVCKRLSFAICQNHQLWARITAGACTRDSKTNGRGQASHDQIEYITNHCAVTRLLLGDFWI